MKRNAIWRSVLKALVTGGTGFLGSHIVRALVEAGHSTRVLRRETSPLDLVQDLPVEHAIGDVLDGSSLVQAMQGCDWVFHVAAVSDYWRANRIQLYLVNVNGTINVLNAARKAGVRRVIFTSSGAAVGLRDDGRPADESTPFNRSAQQFPYGHSKFLAEQEVQRAVAQGSDVVTVNPAVVIGPGDLNQISGSAVIELARGNIPVYPAGGVTIIDVRDVAAAHLAAAEKGRTGERYLLGAADLSTKALQKLIANIVGVPAPTIAVPPAVTPLVALAAENLRRLGITLPMDATQIRLSARNIYFDCHKAWRELGEPQIDIQQSLKDTYDWYVDHGVINRMLAAN
jgi:dihydroflavonol-4-reductase